MASMDSAIAVHRFGLGARGDEALPADPRRWLLDQLQTRNLVPDAIAALPGSGEGIAAVRAYRANQAERRQARQAVEGQGQSQGQVMAESASVDQSPRNAERMAIRDDLAAASAARISHAIATQAPFVERLVHFWANHFAVSVDKQPVRPLAGPFEAEAIRPNVLGNFEDMLLSVEQHPAMLLYLDQAQSIGPNSPMGARAAQRQRQRNAGLNENLAREILELHTLGAGSGYTQADVTEFARALTGWTVPGLGRGGAGGARGGRRNGQQDAGGSFLFNGRAHEPGLRTVLGQRFGENGERQGRDILRMIAAHPATARHIATKLARHFIADDPPAAAVDRIAAAFTRSNGNLPTVYRALIDSPAAWQPGNARFRSPFEWLVGSMRALGDTLPPRADNLAIRHLQTLGQPLWRPGSPAGYDDHNANWAGPDALFRRVETAGRLAQFAGNIDTRALAQRIHGERLSEATATAIARAESPVQATAILLSSPEALWR